jgi:hypothetical protein
MPNNRIYYAIQQVSIGSGITGSGIPGTGLPGTTGTGRGSPVAIHGLQSVGLTTNFNLEQIYEMGQLALYQNFENLPDIEVTLNKVLDGYPLIYTLATEKGTGLQAGLIASSGDLAGRANTRTDLQLAIYPDTGMSATGGSLALVTCSGLYVSSVSYTFPVDGNFTEDVTLVGNDKIWSTAVITGVFTGNNDAPAATAGVNRRQHLQMDSCVFPKEIPGISSSGTNSLLSTASGYAVHFQNITVSCDLGREAIYELGRRTPYHRFVSFPVEVTSEFEVVSISGEWIQATAEGYWTGDVNNPSVANSTTDDCALRYNLRDQVIYLETCEGTRIGLGKKNKLTSVNYTGGDTGGGNVSVTYSYSNFNDFTVAHSGGLFHSSVTSGV